MTQSLTDGDKHTRSKDLKHEKFDDPIIRNNAINNKSRLINDFVTGSYEAISKEFDMLESKLAIGNSNKKENSMLTTDSNHVETQQFFPYSNKNSTGSFIEEEPISSQKFVGQFSP